MSLLTNLKTILGDDVEPDIVEYVNSIRSDEDLREFFENIVDKSNPKHLNAYETIRQMLFGKRRAPKSQIKIETPNYNESTKQKTAPKGKKKFSDIKTFQEKKKKSTGRKICDCEGQVHEFMNNCLNCGRIHCMEEGPGPCFFCQEPITLMGDDNNFANIQKNKKPKENKVFDDDNDYFQTSTSKTDKSDRSKMVIALDFASRRIIESTEEDLKIKKRLHEDIKKHLTNVEKMYQKLQKQSETFESLNETNDLVEILIQMRHRKPVGTENLGVEDAKSQIIDYGSKVYDEELISNTDHGLCISLHQPYASLLVAGVKKHEGRTWRTNHRGRLWIAAAAKQPDEDEIDALENFYKQYYNDSNMKFPRDYPTSCLLGCVFVEDCLDQESYRKIYPNGESGSPYVLICSNPIILPIFYPIVGKHKIYPLDKELHNCAKLSIRHAIYSSD